MSQMRERVLAPVSLRISSRALSSGSWLRAQRATAQPSRARARAMARPMPRLAPPTRAALPSRPVSMGVSWRRWEIGARRGLEVRGQEVRGTRCEVRGTKYEVRGRDPGQRSDAGKLSTDLDGQSRMISRTNLDCWEAMYRRF